MINTRTALIFLRKKPAIAIGGIACFFLIIGFSISSVIPVLNLGDIKAEVSEFSGNLADDSLSKLKAENQELSTKWGKLSAVLTTELKSLGVTQQNSERKIEATKIISKDSKEAYNNIPGLLKSGTAKPGYNKYKAINSANTQQASKNAVDKEGIGGYEAPLVDDATSWLVKKWGTNANKFLPSLNTLFKKNISMPDLSNYHLQLDTPKEIANTIEHLPLGMPVSYDKITSGFGSRLSPFTGTMKKHEGKDYGAPVGRKVIVTGDGKVIKSTWDHNYGLVIDVDHGLGITTRYAHLSKSFVRDGEILKKGDIIGLVGQTGAATGPHLHYEVQVNGNAFNPDRMEALRKRIGSVVEG